MTDIEKQLVILRMSLQAAQSSFDALSVLLLSEKEIPEKESCQHRNKKEMAVMGNPDAWICLDCPITSDNQNQVREV